MPKKNYYFKSLDTLKILKFWDIVKSSNVCMLDLDYYEGKRYSNDKKHELQQIWDRLYDEYFILRNDSLSKFELEKHFKGLVLGAKIVNLTYGINIIESLKRIQNAFTQQEIMQKRVDLYNNLKEIHPKIQYQYFNSLDLDRDYLLKFKNALQNSYNINHKPKEKVMQEQVNNVYKVVANVESWLERSLPIDEITVSRWLAYEQQVLDKQKAVKNGKQ